MKNRRTCFFVIAILLLPPLGPAKAQEDRTAEARRVDRQIARLYQQGKYAEALPLAQRAAEIRKRALGEDHPDYAASLNDIGELYRLQGKYAEAEPFHKRSLAIREKALGANHPDVAISLNNLALLYGDEGRYAEAEPLFARSLAIMEKSFGPDHPNVATILNNFALSYCKQSQYAEAEPLYKRALSIDEKALGPDHPGLATDLNNLAALYVSQGRYAEAEPLYARALAIKEKALGPDHPDVAMSLNNLAELYRKRGRYAEAEPLYKRALAIKEKALGPDHPAVALGLNNLAALYDEQGRYSEAKQLYERALTIREKALGPNHPDVAQSLDNLAHLYHEQGRFTEAEPLHKRALTIREKALGPNHPDMAQSLSGLAANMTSQGRYAEAEPLYQRALAITEKALGPDHPEVADSLGNLADLYVKEGKYVEAESLYKRALKVREGALGPDHPDVATSLNNLGTLYYEQGRYAEAAPLYERALAIDRKALGPEHPDIATDLNNLAALYDDQGKYDEAEPFHKRALAIWEKALGPDHPTVAICLNGLAVLYVEQGRYAEAEPLHRRALAIKEKVLGPDHPGVAKSLNNLAVLYDEQGKYGEAEPLHRRALAIEEKALGPDHPGVAKSLNNLAVLYDKQGKYGEAEPLHRRALALEVKALGADHPDVATILFNLAGSYHAQGRFAEAEPFYARGLHNLSSQFEQNFSYMSEKDRLQFVDTVSERFPMYFSLCLDHRNELPTIAGKMYDVVLWEKGFIAQSVAALRAKIQAGGDPEARRLLDRLTEKKGQLAKLASNPPGSDRQGQVARLLMVELLQKEANDLEQELATRSNALGEEERLARISWKQVRDALKPGDAAVEIVRFPFYDGKRWTGAGYYVALVLSRDSEQPEFLVLGEQKDLERVPLTDYRRLVAVSETDSKRPAGLGRRFYSAFWQPLEAKLKGVNRLYISPDGILNQVSLGVVPGNDGRLLMEAYDLRTVNSTRDVIRGEVPPGPGTAILVGNPKFELGDTDQRATLESARPARTEAAPAKTVQAADTQGLTGQRSRDLRGGALTELPETQQEIEDLAAVLKRKAWKVQTFTGAAALEERVKNTRQPRVLHLATHGFFEVDQPRRLGDGAGWIGDKLASALEDPMLRSGLYLAGANRVLKGNSPGPDMDDGILTAYEASQLDLQGTELVVLSACETGLGKIEAGEGVFGLRRALQVAGAQAVLMSMWSVPDQETRELMVLFYKKWLGGKEKHQALREAQLEMREKVKARYGEDLPLYWGAFVLVGR